MKKNQSIRFGVLALAFVCMIATSACSSAQTEDSSEISSAKPSEQSEATMPDENSSSLGNYTTIYGKVTSIDGNEITLAVGTLNAIDAMSGATGKNQPIDQAANGQPNGQGQGQPNAQPNEQNGMPQGNETAVPQSGSNSEANAQLPDLLTLTGESKTIVIEDESILFKTTMGRESGPQGKPEENSQQVSQMPQDNLSGETATLSEIQEGSILDKTTPRLIQFHTFKNAVNPPFLGGFSIFSTVAA
ncbi:MAG: hypothetical protein ACFWUC_08070 [Oscillospiraceae bacterium]|jgi:hypothetical protein